MLTAKEAKKLAGEAKKRKSAEEVERRNAQKLERKKKTEELRLEAWLNAETKKINRLVRRTVLSAAFKGISHIQLEPHEPHINQKLKWCHEAGFLIETLSIGFYVKTSIELMTKREVTDLYIAIRNLVNDCIDGLTHQPITDNALCELRDNFEAFQKHDSTSALKRLLKEAWVKFSWGYEADDDVNNHWANTWAEKLGCKWVFDKPFLSTYLNVSSEDKDTISHQVRWDDPSDQSFINEDWVNLNTMSWLSTQGQEFLEAIELVIKERAAQGFNSTKIISIDVTHGQKYKFRSFDLAIPYAIAFKEIIFQFGYKCKVEKVTPTANKNTASAFVVSW